MKTLITLTTILVLFLCVLPMAKASQESEHAGVLNHTVEPHTQHESHGQHESHAHRGQHWAEHQTSWASSDDFAQWQKDIQEWTGKMQQWAKEMATMRADMKNRTAGSAPAPVPGPMPVMPPMPSMPANAGIPVLPVVAPPTVPSTGSLPVPRSYGTPAGTAPIPPGETTSRSYGTPTGTAPILPGKQVSRSYGTITGMTPILPGETASRSYGTIATVAPVLPGETASTGRSARDVEVKKDKYGKYVATRQMQFVAKGKPGAALVIRNNLGRIVLRPSTDGKCDVRGVIRARAKTSDEARTKVEQVGMTVNSSEERYYVKPITRDSGEWGDLSVDLFVTVPAGIEPDLQINVGRIELHDFRGKIKAVTQLGDIHAVNAAGDLELFTKTGSIAFTAPKDLSAEFDIQTKMGSITTDLPLEIDQSDMFRRSAQGTVGAGEENIRLTTNMGHISLKWHSQSSDSPAH